MLKKFGVVALVICVAFFGYRFYFRSGSRSVGSSFSTAQVKKGALFVTVNSTGTLQPEEVVDVGAQVAGKISSFGLDSRGLTIDYGSEVAEGTVLAKIDDSIYTADLLQAEAMLKRANASSQQAHAKYVQADRDWTRAQKLGSSAVLAQSSFDASQAAYLLAKADISIADAEISQAEAALTKAKRNLDNCTIRSPVRGVIIDRRVNIGQTVVSSLNAPSLFLIAKDLKHMEVWVSVNEADIASITPKQEVIFTVDAIPGVEFAGAVEKVRLNASMTQNVVTYVVEVRTDNLEGKLLPYLTANVKFLLSKFDNVFLVPASALRWTPTPELLSSWSVDEKKQEDGLSLEQKSGHIGGRSIKRDDSNNSFAADRGVLWVYDGTKGRELKVKVLGVDSINAAIEGQGVAEGLEVIAADNLSEIAKSATPAGSSSVSPFTPTIGRGRR